MTFSRLELIEIYDLDDDHEVGGQDLPYLVTASYEGSYQAAADLIYRDESLVAHNVRPAARRSNLPAHVEFRTFESRSTIYRFFGVPQPQSPNEELALGHWVKADQFR